MHSSAGTSAKGVCGACGAPWVRQVEVAQEHISDQSVSRDSSVNFAADMPKTRKHTKTLGWHPSCACFPDVLADRINLAKLGDTYYNTADVLAEQEGWIKPAIVLDPFGGAGTVALVAQRLGRKALCIEISAPSTPTWPKSALRARPTRDPATQPRKAGRVPAGVLALMPRRHKLAHSQIGR